MAGYDIQSNGQVRPCEGQTRREDRSRSGRGRNNNTSYTGRGNGRQGIRSHRGGTNGTQSMKTEGRHFTSRESGNFGERHPGSGRGNDF
jgi:hypothetical protein